MTLFDATAYDARAAKRKLILGIVALVVLIVAGVVVWQYPRWHAEHVVNEFFDAIQRNDMKTAFGLWTADPDWQKHPEKQKNYTFGQFELDWGPASEWGTIRSHRIEAALTKGSSVIMAITINDTTRTAFLIYNKDKTIDFSPVEIRWQ